MAGLVRAHTQLCCFDKSVPHRQDFKGNFQAPSLPSPDEFEQGRGEARWNWRSQGVSCGRRRCDNRRRHQNCSWLRNGQKDRLSSCFSLPGWWKVLRLCSRVVRCADEWSHRWEWRAIKYYSHHLGSSLWVQACWHRTPPPRCDFYWLGLPFGACKWGWCLLSWEQCSFAESRKGSLCPCIQGKGDFPLSSAKKWDPVWGQEQDLEVMIKKESNVGVGGLPGGIWLKSFSVKKRTHAGRDCNL